MNAAKIRLSAEEKELVMNIQWILTKNSVLQKINQLFGNLQVCQQKFIQHYYDKLPAGFTHSSPKISKGNNYKNLPYLILDYPKHFDEVAVFAIRTMFWWGNFFSITLHIAGTYQQGFENKITAAYPLLKKNGFCCCVNSNQWEHHFDPDNFIPINQLTETDFKGYIQSKKFIKIAKKTSPDLWDDLPEILLDDYKLLIRIVSA